MYQVIYVDVSTRVIAVEASSLIEWMVRVVAMPAVLEFFPGLGSVVELGNGPVYEPVGRVGVITSWGESGEVGWVGWWEGC